MKKSLLVFTVFFTATAYAGDFGVLAENTGDGWDAPSSWGENLGSQPLMSDAGKMLAVPNVDFSQYQNNAQRITDLHSRVQIFQLLQDDLSVEKGQLLSGDKIFWLSDAEKNKGVVINWQKAGAWNSLLKNYSKSYGNKDWDYKDFAGTKSVVDVLKQLPKKFLGTDSHKELINHYEEMLPDWSAFGYPKELPNSDAYQIFSAPGTNNLNVAPGRLPQGFSGAVRGHVSSGTTTGL
jgi:hypothetical protein